MFHPEDVFDETVIDANFTPSRPGSVGELNYCICRLIDNFIYDTSPDGESYNYQQFNNVLGVLSCVKEELYRRFIYLYEWHKRAENGEVFCHIDTMAELMEHKSRLQRMVQRHKIEEIRKKGP
jgi:hypothetical protein